MAIKIVLILGALLLGCCSSGLLIVRLTNPRLKGLGWLGSAFASGCTGAALLYFGDMESLYLSIVVADLLVLASFVLLHKGAQEFAEAHLGLPVLGFVLLALQFLADLYVISGSERVAFHICVVGLLVAAQTGETAYTLAQRAPHSIRVPAMLTTAILVGFMALNIVRSAAAAFGWLSDEKVFLEVKLVAFTVYLVVALGIGFGFFWMTTSRLTAELDLLASTDPLTRLFNRRVFLRWCEKEVERSNRTGIPFSILIIDLDHFKRLNDEHGHHAGDAALCAVVEKMQDSVRGLDILGRWGGEEFVALLPAASPEAAVLVANRMRIGIEKILLPRSEESGKDIPSTVKVTASIGVCTYRGREDGLSGMLRRADAALYDAKAAGRNRIISAL